AEESRAHVRAVADVLCFFFQAEDGIRDRNVTGVQTCALPISPACAMSGRPPPLPPTCRATKLTSSPAGTTLLCALLTLASSAMRSEERRVGKEGRSG